MRAYSDVATFHVTVITKGAFRLHNFVRFALVYAVLFPKDCLDPEYWRGKVPSRL